MKDKHIGDIISHLMLAGVAVAATVTLAGLVWYLSAHPDVQPGDHIFNGEPKYFENPLTMVQRAFSPHATGERRSVIMIGILVLLINPPLRTAFAALGFFAQKDRLYTAVSLLVLAILLFSFFG